MLAFIPLYAYLKGVNVYSSFIEGAKEGFWLAVKILPYMVSIFVAIGVFRDSGAMEILENLLSPLLRLMGLPGELLPLAIVRPLSGSGSLAITIELLRQWGPDSFIGRLASTIQGSTDTTFYVLTLYFGSVGITRTRHALPAGLLADLAGIVTAVLLVQAFFGS